MPVEAKETGYVQKLNAEEVGKIAMHLGAGRMKKRRQYRLCRWNRTNKKSRLLCRKRRNNSIYIC